VVDLLTLLVALAAFLVLVVSWMMLPASTVTTPTISSGSASRTSQDPALASRGS